MKKPSAHNDPGRAAGAGQPPAVSEETDEALGSTASPDVLKLALEREKLALEREKLALEREQLHLDRDRWQADLRLYDRRRRLFVLPGVSVAAALVFCVIGMAVGALVRRPPTIQLDARKVDSPLLLKSENGTEERRTVAYLLLVK
jgi:hypothetical protein